MLSIGAALVFLVTASATFAYLTLSEMFVKPVPPSNPEIPELSTTPTPDPLAAYTIALLGHGSPGHQGGLLTDSIMLVHIAPRAERVTLLSVPRDIWVELPLIQTAEGTETRGYKINASYAIGKDLRQYPDRPEQFGGKAGGGMLASYALERVTGLPIKYFVAVNFDAFKQAIDQLGGIDVRVPRGFVDPYYPLAGKEANTCGFSEETIAALTATLSGELLDQAFTCRFERLMFDAGKQTMDGETALKYVRSRHAPESGGDFNRALRQQSVVEALKDKIISLQFIPKIPQLLTTLSRNIETSIPPDQIHVWINSADTLQTYEISHIVLTSETVLTHGRSSDGQYILQPADPSEGENPWLNVHGWIDEQLQENALP